MTAEIIAFPLQHRVVPTEETLVVMPLKLSQKDEQASIIDHDGRPYKLADLIRHLSPAELRQVGETAPRTGQALWDEVVRRWPALAAEIVAGISPPR